MIVQMAVAEKGFINVNETPNFVDNDNFKQCLLKLFNFENIDIQEFDGNNCTIISKEDPTNSIFIYENQQGSFIYQITNAVPKIHKNNKLWFCDCFEIENFEKINSLLENRQKNIEAVCLKNILPMTYIANKKIIPTKTEIKNNFKTIAVSKINLTPEDQDSTATKRRYTFLLKIKCMTNPFFETINIDNYSTDGSFNFFFPVSFVNSSSFSKLTDGTTTTDLSKAISKYSEFIKSIELIPFFYNSISFCGSSFEITNKTDSLITVGEFRENATFTELGVLCQSGYSNLGIQLLSYSKNDFPAQLVYGGGVRGFIRTPVGNVDLNFNDCYDNKIICKINEDGLSFDGLFKCDIPPIYLNFYTDNAGQVFIQNMTTNAQELRSLERNLVFTEQQREINENYNNKSNLINTIGGFASNLASGNIAGAIGSIFGGVSNVISQTFTSDRDKAITQANYNNAFAEYEDKIKTNTLLSNYTGKTISGNRTLLDFLPIFSNNFFMLVLETNFLTIMTKNNDENHFQYLGQSDYDYSIEYKQDSIFDESDYDNLKARYIFDLNKKTKDIFIELFYSKVDRYDPSFIQGNIAMDGVGLNYETIFYLTEISTGNPSDNFFDYKNTKPFALPIRRKIFGFY